MIPHNIKQGILVMSICLDWSKLIYQFVSVVTLIGSQLHKCVSRYDRDLVLTEYSVYAGTLNTSIIDYFPIDTSRLTIDFILCKQPLSTKYTDVWTV